MTSLQCATHVTGVTGPDVVAWLGRLGSLVYMSRCTFDFIVSLDVGSHCLKGIRQWLGGALGFKVRAAAVCAGHKQCTAEGALHRMHCLVWSAAPQKVAPTARDARRAVSLHASPLLSWRARGLAGRRPFPLPDPAFFICLDMLAWVVQSQGRKCVSMNERRLHSWRPHPTPLFPA
jgi:hypothetical protein